MKDFVVPLYYFNRPKRRVVATTQRTSRFPASRFPTWNLARGATQQYNIHDHNRDITNGTLINAPDEFTINSNSEIIADLTDQFHYDPPAQLTLESSVGTITIPISVRDWFPVDFDYEPEYYFCAWRAWDATARDLWTARYFSPLALTDGGLQFSTEIITVRSADNGYIDYNALRQQLLDIGYPGLLEVESVVDQINGNDLNYTDDDDLGRLHAGTINTDQTLQMRSINGKNFFRSVWSPGNLNDLFLNSLSGDRGGGEYKTTDGETGAWHAMLNTCRKHGSGYQQNYSGDENSYPGFRYVTGTGGVSTNLRWNTRGTRPGDLQLSDSRVDAWHTDSGYTLSGNVGVTNLIRRLESFRLDTESSLSGTVVTGTVNEANQHVANGAELEMDEWDWSELAMFNIGQSFSDSQAYRNNFQTFINSQVAYFTGADFIYA